MELKTSKVLGPSKGAGQKSANKARNMENEPIRCASPPCYLSEIED
jgi:hypothetical protein